MKCKSMIIFSAFVVSGATYFPVAMASDNEVEIKIIHMGDVHGHLISRPNVRSDGSGRMEGGLARMYTKIKSIRGDHPERTMLVNTGDSIQGSVEALHTKGQAVIDVLNLFKIDVFAPGNWDFVYGTTRFKEVFVGDPANGIAPLAPWGAISTNLYVDDNLNGKKDATELTRILPPYIIKVVNGVRVGVIGFTTDRGPQVVGSSVTKGFAFLNSSPGSAGIVGSDVSQVEKELQDRIAEVKPQVDLVVVASELGLANNILLAERNAGIDLILSSDMHEETRQPVVTANGTIVVEEGQDGTMIGALEFEFTRDAITGVLTRKSWEWMAYTIDDSIAENSTIKSKVTEVRAPFVQATYNPAAIQANIYSGRKPAGPIDAVIGYAGVDLHRTNYSQQVMPAVVEGSGHDFITDAFRSVGIARYGAEMDAATRPSNTVGAIRGFRYGTHIKTGPIKREDIYHFLAIGPKVACGTLTGASIKKQIEDAADGSLNPDPRRWTGGWLFGFSGLTMDLYGITGAVYNADGSTASLNRARNVQVQNKSGAWSALVTTADAVDVNKDKYTYCSYYYDADPTLINRASATNIKVINDASGIALDGVEVVEEYLKSLPNLTATPVLNRTTIIESMPAPTTTNLEVQPWSGAY